MFKVGDVVVRTEDVHKNDRRKCVTGIPVTVLGEADGNLIFSEEDGGGGWFAQYFSLYKPEFDLKTMPWKIVVKSPEESRMAQEWLREQGLNWPVGGEISSLDSPILTNCVKGSLNPEACYMHSYTDDGRDLAPEIKLTFGVSAVEYPEIPTKETEVQKKLRELEDKQRNIAEEIAKLRETM